MTSERWNTAVHESGHAVSAIVLGGRCKGLILLDDGTSGCAELEEILGNRQAYATAAGPAAERLASEYAPPEEPVKEQSVTVDNFEDAPLFESSPYLTVQLARTAETRKIHKSDNRLIAEWAIGGNEDQPETWAERVAHCHQMAAEIVERNAAKIIRVAERLFVRGCLNEREILELLNEA
jgi:hypothetical protein